VRTSIFVAPELKMIEGAAACGTDRIELYTEAYAQQYTLNPEKAVAPYAAAAVLAHELGLGINAGHDLSLENIEYFAKNVPNLAEVSIGHALICEALYQGLETVIQSYLKKLAH
jgi:pyridoxine 5-phosphate synthase